MAGLELRNVTKRFGGETVLDGLSFKLDPGGALMLQGPSGCGKTTALRVIAGFESADAGSVVIGGRNAADPSYLPPRARSIGMIFQHGALWPHMSAERHLRFVLNGCGLSRKERRARAEELLERCRLAHRRKARPATLSGGERQRLALARALAQRPRLLLLDEAFNNLDPDLCEHVVGLLNAYRRAHDAAVVLTTHEPGWAADIADCAVRMEARPYRIEEVASRTRGIEPAGDAC